MGWTGLCCNGLGWDRLNGYGPGWAVHDYVSFLFTVFPRPTVKDWRKMFSFLSAGHGFHLELVSSPLWQEVLMEPEKPHWPCVAAADWRASESTRSSHAGLHPASVGEACLIHSVLRILKSHAGWKLPLYLCYTYHGEVSGNGKNCII